ncbi:uridine kinase [Aquiflexum sp.]|uniref:uridine kinase family protein n=1 Tax=Aquiflexum sp. TaxID=1872584 RepID=UPI0035946365
MIAKTIFLNEPDWMQLIINKIGSLSAQFSEKAPSLIVGIAGGSCTGKSTQIAKKLCAQLPQHTQLLSQDNYQKGIELTNYFEYTYHWDDPANFGIEEGRQMLETLKSGKIAQMPVYSFERKKPVGYKKIQSTPVILFEGLYALHAHLKPLVDFSIYVESPLYGRLLRRVFRNAFDRYRQDPELVFERLLTGKVYESHRAEVVRQKENCDFTVHNPYCFSETIHQFDLKPMTSEILHDVLYIYALNNDFYLKVVKDKSDQMWLIITDTEHMYSKFSIKSSSLDQLKKLDLDEM